MIELVGWGIAVVLAVPSIWLAALAFHEARRARVASDRGVMLAEASLELAQDSAVRAAREARAEFAARLRELEVATRTLQHNAADSDYERIFEMHVDMHSRALALGERTGTWLVEYAGLVHFMPDQHRLNTVTSPRDRPRGVARKWMPYGSIEAAWIDDPESVVDVLTQQGADLIADATSVRNLKQWHKRWPWS